MIGILGSIILIVLLFDGHTLRKQNTELLEQNKEILERLKFLQTELEMKRE
ncbi:hypothetical protein [Lysinibacillus sp. 3P01SB]|uniref:hypothetical protein n=1 Tax=Lysinibacillus sp. 3P01SB TaxID=3132284 RepID=UPI0039A62E6C